MAVTKLSPDSTRILRHMVATIAYRASRSLRNAPADFAAVRLGDGAMSAAELILHMTNVLAFALAAVSSTDRIRHNALDYPQQVRRFYGLLGELDTHLAAGASLEDGMDLKLIQGPFADVLTHIGQLHAMRRMLGVPIAAANYIHANVQIGRTALEEQPD